MIWRVDSKVYVQFHSLRRKFPSALLLQNNRVYPDSLYRVNEARKKKGRLLATEELTVWQD